MLKTILPLGSVLALIVLWWHFSGQELIQREDRPAQNDSSSPVAVDAPKNVRPEANGTADEGVSLHPLEAPAVQLQRATTDAQQSVSSEPRPQQPGGAVQASAANASQLLPPAEAEEASRSDAVIGRSFPVSASVTAACRQYSDKCEEEERWLAKMAEEPRDHVWATQIEGVLRESALALPATVRAVECRATLCAIEVASTHRPGLYRGIGGQGQRANNLLDQEEMWGYERDEFGVVVTVTLRIFERHHWDKRFWGVETNQK